METERRKTRQPSRKKTAANLSSVANRRASNPAESKSKELGTVGTSDKTRDSLSRFAYQSETSERDKMEAEKDHADEEINSSVFSDRASDYTPPQQGVTNEDIMLKLCANGAEIAKLTQSVEELRSIIFTLQSDNDNLRKELSEVKGREEELRTQLAEVKFLAEMADRRSEETAAYSRRNNLRIMGLEENTSGDHAETTKECEDKVLSMFKDKLNISVAREDVEAVHRLGTRRNAKTGPNDTRTPPRGVIVRFVSRRVRDDVLYSRKKLRGSKLVMVEDLTPRAYALLSCVRDDTSVCKQAWTKNGKVFMKTLVGKVVHVEKISDLASHREACSKPQSPSTSGSGSKNVSSAANK